MLPEFVLSATAIAYLTAMIAISIGLIIKDVLVNFTSGIMFYMNKNFNDGDHIYLDGEHAIIIRVGFRHTVFQVINEDKVCWRYISNDRVKNHKLDKIITNTKETQDG